MKPCYAMDGWLTADQLSGVSFHEIFAPTTQPPLSSLLIFLISLALNKFSLFVLWQLNRLYSMRVLINLQIQSQLPHRHAQPYTHTHVNPHGYTIHITHAPNAHQHRHTDKHTRLNCRSVGFNSNQTLRPGLVPARLLTERCLACHLVIEN